MRRRPALGLLAALILAQSCGKPRPDPTALHREARDQLRAGNLKQAVGTADRGLTECVPGSEQHWRFRILKAEVLLAQGRPDAALVLLEPRVPDRPEFREIAARHRMNEAHARFMRAEYPQAKRLLDEAAAVAATQPSSLLAEVELRRSATESRLGNAESAERSLRNALELASRHDDPYLKAAAVGNVGFNLLNRSRYDEALPWFEQALAASEKAGARILIASALGNLGRCYYGLGDLDKAVEFHSKAEAMTAELDDSYRRQVWLGDLGEDYHGQANLPAAISCYRRALVVARKIGEGYSIAQWLDSLTLALIDAGDLTAAEAYSREALAASREVTVPYLKFRASLGAGRLATAKRQFAEAAKSYNQILASSPDDESAWEAQAGLASLYVAAGRPADAEPAFQRALSMIEENRTRLARDAWKLSFHSSAMRFYHDYVDFLMAEGRSERALEVAESCRALLLSRKLGIARQAGPPATARFRQTARALNARLVSFWLAPRRSFAWVVRPEGVQSFPLPAEAEIAGLAQAYKETVQGLRDPLDEANVAGARLYAILIRPMERLLPPGSNVVMVPDSGLHELNLETLVVETGRPHYWIEDVRLAVTPSLALLPALAERERRPPASLLLIANPEPPAEDFPALPEVEQEVGAIRKAFEGAEKRVLAGAAATPAAYRETVPGRFSLIHFSAHATANRESPLDSAVILSRGGDSYKLYARDVLQLPLRARLVTISACRGAGAKWYSGEGLVGFTWAFLQAGARNVIAGLWEVNDSSTAALMGHLYTDLGRGAAPGSALRSAKMALIRSGSAWTKPYYWAPFQVYTRHAPF